MAQIKTDNPIDAEIVKQKSELTKTQVKAQAFMATYLELPIKERARILTEITRSINVMDSFILKSKGIVQNNSGTKFALENFKSSYTTFLARWRKFEKRFD